MVKWPFGKRKWEKATCTFVLQEYGAEGVRGWGDITDPTGEVPTKEESMEYFKPGRHYRVMARYIEGEKAGQIAGVVWHHFEKLPGGLKPKEKAPKPKVERAPSKPRDAAELMGEYVDEFVRVATPLAKLNEALAGIREALGVSSAPPQGGGSSGYQIPPLEFSGSAPWMLHPYIVKTVADEVKSVLDYGFTRAEKMMGIEGEAVIEEEEEELGLPSIRRYARREVPAPPAAEEALPPEEEPPPTPKPTAKKKPSKTKVRKEETTVESEK